MNKCNLQLVPEVMGNLAAQRRRVILTCLLNAETGQVTSDALVDYVVDETTHSQSPDREAVAATLYHQHLPKLAADGFIEYERDHGSIRTTAKTELAEPYLEFARRWESESEAQEQRG